MATNLPTEVLTGSFSVQNVSGSHYLFFRGSTQDYFNLKTFGGSIGAGMSQVGFKIDAGIVADLTMALSESIEAGTGSYTYGV